MHRVDFACIRVWAALIDRFRECRRCRPASVKVRSRL